MRLPPFAHAQQAELVPRGVSHPAHTLAPLIRACAEGQSKRRFGSEPGAGMSRHNSRQRIESSEATFQNPGLHPSIRQQWGCPQIAHARVCKGTALGRTRQESESSFAMLARRCVVVPVGESLIRHFVQGAPIQAEFGDGVHKLGEVYGLHNVAIDADRVAFHDIPLFL